MPTLRERIENNLPVFFLATLATGFAAGFATYKAIQDASNVVQVRRADFEQLKIEAEAGRRRTNPLTTTDTDATTATTAADTTPTSPAPQSAERDRALDGTVPVVSSSQCWEYVAQPISIGGRLFDAYAVIDHRCDENEALTFDVRGWRRFEGFVGVTENNRKSNNLTVKVDEQEISATQVMYNKSARELKVDLTGHSTLTFQKSGRYPLVVVGNPKLFRD